MEDKNLISLIDCKIDEEEIVEVQETEKIRKIKIKRLFFLEDKDLVSFFTNK